MPPSRTLGLAGLTIVTILIVVQWVDVPLSHELARFRNARAFLHSKSLQQPILIFMSMAILAFGFYKVMVDHNIPRWIIAGSLGAVALLSSHFITEEFLKPLFSRVMPIVALRGNVSGFLWWHTCSYCRSFPSGHSGQAAAMMAVLWRFYPRLRLLMLLSFIVMGMALMIGEYHYLGDILAGGLVGALVGAGIMKLWKLGRYALKREQGAE